MPTDKESLKELIKKTFVNAKYPGDNKLRNSDMGNEPYLLEQEFRGKTDWQSLDPSFIDRSPDGFGTALSFFSDEAFRFYLPAFLIADIDDKLMIAQPVFYLHYGLDDESKVKYVNPRLYGNETWFELKQRQFSVFNKKEAESIVAYLRYILESGRIVEFQSKKVEEALNNYWLEKAGDKIDEDR